MPLTHDRHAADPVDGWYDPTEQLVHALAPAAEYAPERQSRQLARAVSPADGPNLPAVQSRHAIDPVLGWYSPEGQTVQFDDCATGW